MTNVSTDQFTTEEAPAWQAFADGCPNCGAVPWDAPEGVDRNGDPQWNNPHCFKCGFRPGTNAVTDERQQFEAFKRFMASQPDYQHPTMQPPADDTEAANLRSQLAEAMGELSRLRPGTEAATTPGQAFTPSSAPQIPDQPSSQAAGQFAAPSPMGEQGGTVPPPS